jgi:hypothetical protein
MLTRRRWHGACWCEDFKILEFGVVVMIFEEQEIKKLIVSCWLNLGNLGPDPLISRLQAADTSTSLDRPEAFFSG